LRKAFVLILCTLGHPALAVAAAPEPVVEEGRDVQATMASKAFLDAHPDLKFRVEGMLALEAQLPEQAQAHFLRSASYADKPSQAILAEMAWRGLGQPVDRPLGYAWADLAAERGYRAFVAQRERYWSQLSEAERSRAIEVGQPLLAEYRDDVAKPRMTRHLRLARRGMITGRPRKDVIVVIPSPSGQQMEIRGHDFYATRFWEPKAYHAWVDSVWNDPKQGRVDVGTLEQVETEK
jgi:hypothetical protein